MASAGALGLRAGRKDDMEEKLLEIITSAEAVAPEVWAMVVKQQLWQGWMTVYASIGFGVLFVVSGFWANKDEWHHFMPGCVCIFSGMGFLIAVVFLLVYGISAINNPEYWALMDLIPGD